MVKSLFIGALLGAILLGWNAYTIPSANSNGVFAAVMVGAMIGGLVGAACNLLWEKLLGD